jgi:hypothetical protein
VRERRRGDRDVWYVKIAKGMGDKVRHAHSAAGVWRIANSGEFIFFIARK